MNVSTDCAMSPESVGVSRITLDPGRFLELVAVFTVAMSVLGLATALVGFFLPVQVVLLALLIVAGYAWRTRTREPQDELASRSLKWRHIILLVLVCLFFRLTPYHYVFGGQDQGVYVNMAAHIARTGGVEVTDPVLERLPAGAVRNLYLRDNYSPSYLPGIYRIPIPGAKEPGLEFQFYHLFPVWMAVFEDFFGPRGGVYALTFFAVLSILFCYRLVFTLTGNTGAAVAAGLLLALNPLHAFFSKWPVTEVPTLAFSLIAFCYLAMAWQSKEKNRLPWLMISALSLLSLFTTRISGFMYVPIVMAIATAALLSDADVRRRQAVAAWVGVVLLFYAFSVWYGLNWSGRYSNDIYQISFSRLFGTHWKAGLLACALVAVIGLIGVAVFSSSARFRPCLKSTLSIASGWIGWLTLLVLLVGTYKIFLLGFTDRYVADPWIGKRWHLANNGWGSVPSSSLVAAAVYLFPLIFVAFVAFAWRRWAKPEMQLLSFFLLTILAYLALLQWVVPYQPYYARYLLSEFVPYAIIFVVCGWSLLNTGRFRKAVAACLLLGGIWSGLLSAAQLGKNEKKGAYEGLAGIASRVGDNDVLLLSKDGLMWLPQIKTALVYAFGRNVITVRKDLISDGEYLAGIQSVYDNVFLLSSRPTRQRGFDPRATKRLSVESFRRSHHPPTTTERDDALYHLSQLSSIPLVVDKPLKLAANRLAQQWLDTGWGQTEHWGVWAVGTHARLTIPRSQIPDTNSDDLSLELDLSAHVRPSHRRQNVDVLLNGVPALKVAFEYPGASRKTIRLPLNNVPRWHDAVVVDFEMPDAVSPAAVSTSPDARVLGVGLYAVKIASPDKK